MGDPYAVRPQANSTETSRDTRTESLVSNVGKYWTLFGASPAVGLSPQQMSVVKLSPQVSFQPVEVPWKITVKNGGRGAALVAGPAMPMPRRPRKFEPQQYTLVGESPHVNVPPEWTAVNANPLGRVTGAGTELTPGTPSCPRPAAPQQNASESVVTPQVWSASPAETLWKTGAITLMGVVPRVVRVPAPSSATPTPRACTTPDEDTVKTVVSLLDHVKSGATNVFPCRSMAYAVKGMEAPGTVTTDP